MLWYHDGWCVEREDNAVRMILSASPVFLLRCVKIPPITSMPSVGCCWLLLSLLRWSSAGDSRGGAQQQQQGGSRNIHLWRFCGVMSCLCPGSWSLLLITVVSASGRLHSRNSPPTPTFCPALCSTPSVQASDVSWARDSVVTVTGSRRHCEEFDWKIRTVPQQSTLTGNNKHQHLNPVQCSLVLL